MWLRKATYKEEHKQVDEWEEKSHFILPGLILQIVVLQKTLESPWDSMKIRPINPKENEHWLFTGRTDAEAPILWPPDAKSWFIGRYPDAGKDRRLEEKRTTEDEMTGWHHWLNEHEFEQTLGDSEGQRSLACYSPWGRKIGHHLATEQQQQPIFHITWKVK